MADPITPASAPAATAPAVPAAPARAPAFRWYLAGHATWFIGHGLQFVLFPYLVVDVLKGTPLMMGIAQASILGPQLFFMLIGGATADRRELRRHLISLHLLAMMPPLAFGFIIASGHLSYAVLLGYAFLMGTLTAFAMPARDAMLNRVLPAGEGASRSERLQKAVALSNVMQFAGTVIGMLLAKLADDVGIPALFALHGCALATGAVALSRLDRAPSLRAPDAPRDTLGEIRAGIREALASPAIRGVLIGAFSVGLFFVGAFLVLIPVLLKQDYGGGVDRFATVSLAFWSSTIVATLAIIRFGPIRRKGRALILAYLCGLTVLAVLSQRVPFYALVCLVLFWGLGSGVVQAMGRTLVQEAAPDSHRGRILSIFQLAFSLGAPVGSLSAGALANSIGPHHATLVSVAGMAIVILILRFGTVLWRHGMPDNAR